MEIYEITRLKIRFSGKDTLNVALGSDTLNVALRLLSVTHWPFSDSVDYDQIEQNVQSDLGSIPVW